MKDFKHPKFPTIHIKLLNSTEDLTQLESLLKTDAQAVSGYVPQESSKDSKYMYGIFDNDQLIGIIDLIEEYPTKQGAYIHQFFLADDYNRDNLAEMLYSALEKTVQETGDSYIANLNAADRRIVHHVVSQYDDISSFSEGEGRDRRIIIAQKSS